ncbi:MAG: hypothetical protein NZ928_03650 [Endomicrobia bacterium]|nr:hypothetical protein [Endomicrobiia bacterium]MDW8056233.1 hypothetical protein [Elusimicrobiota bacterium]
MKQKIKNINLQYLIFLLLYFFISLIFLYAQLPDSINYQGRYFVGGEPVTGTRPNCYFKITNESGSVVYYSTGPLTITFRNGLFNWQVPCSTVAWASPPSGGYHLEVTIDEQVIGRERILAVPYAFYSSSAGYSLAGAGWVDEGTVVRLETEGDSVRIGGSGTPSGKLTVLSTGTSYSLFVSTAVDGSSKNFLVRNNGWIGIGCEPAAPVHIRLPQDYGTGLSIDARDTAGGRQWSLIATGSSAVEGQGKFLIKDENATAVRMTIDTLGNVGINVSTPQAKLHVIGDIGISGVANIRNISNDSAVTILGGTSSVTGAYFKVTGKDIGGNAEVVIHSSTSTLKIYAYDNNAWNELASLTGAGGLPQFRVGGSTYTGQYVDFADLTSDPTGAPGRVAYVGDKLKLYTAGSWVDIATGTIPAGGIVSGSGTTNRVARFTGTTTIGNSTITDDGTNVDITATGWTRTGGQLIVLGSATVAGVGGLGVTYGITAGTITLTGARIFSTVSGPADNIILSSHTTVSGQLIVVGSATVQGAAFSVGGSTLVITTGRVGIGESSPGVKLAIHGDTTKSTTATEDLLKVASKGTSDPIEVKLGVRTHSTSENRKGYIDVVEGTTPRPLRLQPSGGTIGIGPNVVEAVNAGLVYISTGGSNILPAIALENNSTTSGDSISMLFKVHSAGATNFKGGIVFERTGTNGRGSLHLCTNDVSDTSNVSLSDKRLTITSGGAVVITGSATVFGVGGLGVTYGITAGTITLTGARIFSTVSGPADNIILSSHTTVSGQLIVTGSTTIQGSGGLRLDGGNITRIAGGNIYGDNTNHLTLYGGQSGFGTDSYIKISSGAGNIEAVLQGSSRLEVMQQGSWTRIARFYAGGGVRIGNTDANPGANNLAVDGQIIVLGSATVAGAGGLGVTYGITAGTITLTGRNIFSTATGTSGNITLSSHTTVVGQLIVTGSATVQGSAFSVGGSTLVVAVGRVGIGTGVSSAKLDIRSSPSDTYSLAVGTTSTPYSFTISTAGHTNIRGNLSLDTDEGVGPRILFYDHTDTPWSIHNQLGRMRFVYGATERLTVTSEGKVGINEVAPYAGVHIVAPTGEPAAVFMNGKVGIETISPGASLDVNSSTSNARIFQARCGATFGISVSTDGRVGVCVGMPNTPYALQVGYEGEGFEAISSGWAIYSDRKWKKDITTLTQQEYEGLVRIIDNVQIVKYRYKGDKPDRKFRIGMISDETPQELLTPQGDGISLADTIGVLIAVVKYQNAKINELENEIKQLKKGR